MSRIYHRHVFGADKSKVEIHNIIEVRFIYGILSDDSIAAFTNITYRDPKYRYNNLSDAQLTEFDNFITSIKQLIISKNFEFGNGVHQSNRSYSYYIPFWVRNRQGMMMDNHEILLRASNHYDSIDRNDLKSNSMLYFGSNKTLLDDIVISAGNANDVRFKSIDSAYSYINDLFEDLLDDKIYGLRQFPIPGTDIPKPYSYYYTLMFDYSKLSNKKFYTYESARFMLSNEYEPLGWAIPIGKPEVVNRLIREIGNILICRYTSDNSMVIFYLDGNRFRTLSKTHLLRITESD